MSVRTLVTDYAKKQQAMIQEAKESADNLLSGIDARDVMYEPDKFQQFVVEKAFARFQEGILKPASNLGFKLAQDLRSAAPAPTIKVKRGKNA